LSKGEKQTMTPGEKAFPARAVEEFCVNVLTKAGLSPDCSAIVAESLLCAEMRGIKSHGVLRLESYIQRCEAGVMNIQAPITTEMDNVAVALLNANNTFGSIAGHRAMMLAIGKAKQYGTGVVAVKNSNHFGIAAYYSLMVLKEDMVGCVLTNAAPAMAVYGTKTPLIGTNPLSVAIPAGDQPPIVLDMATSVVARGKIIYSALTGHKIPLGWARDSEGKPTVDAQDALKGSLEPIGGVKGSALSLIIDIICGIVTDTVLTGGVRNLADIKGPAKIGHFFAALNVSRFIDMALFKANVDRVIRNIKSLAPVDGGPVYLPGEIEYLCSKRSREEGIPLENEVIRSLNAVATRYGASRLTNEIP
jgi:LDH2 family malate/lactate/ureidoglycolate dehydrogenase